MARVACVVRPWKCARSRDVAARETKKRSTIRGSIILTYDRKSSSHF